MMNNPISHDVTRLKFKVINTCEIHDGNKEVVLSQVVGPNGDSYTLAQRVNVDGNPVYLKGTFHLNFDDLLDIKEFLDQAIEQISKKE